MNDFLLVLFYQAIVAVNTAVILNSIIWLAKRKDEKDERKPNPDFTPPPTRNSGGYQPKPCEMPKPPTTGTSAVKPKKRKYDKYSALTYAADTVQRFYKPILTSAIVQAVGGKIIIPPEEAGTPISGYGDGKIYGYVQTLAPDDGNDDGKAYPINPRTGEVEGYPTIDGTVYRVYFWTSGKAAKTVHVAPFDGALKAEPVSIYNPAEESVKRYERDFVDAKCEKCKYFIANYAGDFGYCVQSDEIKHPYEVHGCFEK